MRRKPRTTPAASRQEHSTAPHATCACRRTRRLLAPQGLALSGSLAQIAYASLSVAKAQPQSCTALHRVPRKPLPAWEHLTCQLWQVQQLPLSLARHAMPLGFRTRSSFCLVRTSCPQVQLCTSPQAQEHLLSLLHSVFCASQSAACLAWHCSAFLPFLLRKLWPKIPWSHKGRQPLTSVKQGTLRIYLGSTFLSFLGPRGLYPLVHARPPGPALSNPRCLSSRPQTTSHFHTF